MRLTSKVPFKYHQTTLLHYLSQRFTYLSPDAWQQKIEAHEVWLNDQLSHPQTVVRQNDAVSCEVGEWQRPFANLNYQIIYQDDWLLAVNKPPFLRVHSKGRFLKDNLIYQLRTPEHGRHPPFPEAQLVNRLDADTSGLVLIARQPEVVRHLNQQLANGRIEKVYHALVQGHPHPATGTINQPLGNAKNSRVRSRQTIQPQGKPACTHYQTEQTFEAHTLLQLMPQTGRTHQLRVHLASIGHPIVGDALYTMTDDAYLAWTQKPIAQRQTEARLPRQALHCTSMTFQHPHTEQKQTITAPIATDLNTLLSELRHYAGGTEQTSSNIG